MKMETQWERHCLSGILLMMIVIAIAMFTNTRMVYAETETGNGYHYQKTGNPLVTEKDNYENIWQIYASTEDEKYIATITYGEGTNSSYPGQFSVFSNYESVFAKYNIVQVEVGEGLTYFNVAKPPKNLQYEYIYLPSTMKKLTSALVQQQKKLKEITIPASVTEFNSGSFNHGMKKAFNLLHLEQIVIRYYMAVIR